MLVHPSPVTKFPSSHISQYSKTPFPHTQRFKLQEVSGFEAENGGEFDEASHNQSLSTRQLLHPVPTPLPSPRSQSSVPTVIPSPQVVEHALSPGIFEQGHVHPVEPPEHPGQLTSSQISEPTQIPSPQIAVQMFSPGVGEQGHDHPDEAPEHPGQ